MTTLEITASGKEGRISDSQKMLLGLEREGRLLRAKQDIPITPMPTITETEKAIDYMAALDAAAADRL